jgi:ABC-2 type transport system permease protein
MRKIFFVLVTEIKNTVLRPSFIIFTFGVPIMAFLLLLAFTSVSEGSQESITSLVFSSPPANSSQGYVDPGGVIEALPSNLAESDVTLLPFDTEEAAKSALRRGEISAYFIIPADVVESGEMFAVMADFTPLSSAENQWAMEWTLVVNLMGGDEEKAALVQYPLIETRVSRAADAPLRDEDNPLNFVVPYVITIFFYMMIVGSASLMLNSIGKEKANRVIEVLLLSVSPRQLLTGKIIALGLVGLLQTAIYISLGSILLNLSGRSFEAAAAFNLPSGLLAWGLVFFLLGYAIYASLLAGAGALAPNTREASQITFIVIIPMIIPLFFINSLISDSNSAISVILSLFPFSAPVAMMTRLVGGSVPLWQLVLAASIMAATAYLIIVLVARLFRAQTLLSGQEFKVGTYFKALLDRG